VELSRGPETGLRKAKDEVLGVSSANRKLSRNALRGGQRWSPRRGLLASGKIHIQVKASFS